MLTYAGQCVEARRLLLGWSDAVAEGEQETGVFDTGKTPDSQAFRTVSQHLNAL